MTIVTIYKLRSSSVLSVSPWLILLFPSIKRQGNNRGGILCAADVDLELLADSLGGGLDVRHRDRLLKCERERAARYFADDLVALQYGAALAGNALAS